MTYRARMFGLSRPVVVGASVVGQTATPTPTPGLGPDELVDYWPVVVRGGWFLAGFLVVAAVGLLVVEPLVSRFVRRRNRNNPTIQDAITRYLRLLVLVVAFFAGAGVAGYSRFLSDSALVVAAGTLAIGVAGQTVLGSIVSGLALVMDPEFSVGDFIEWSDYQGVVQSITLRITRIRTPDGELVTIPNTSLTGDAIIRPYGRDRNRIVERVGVDYDDDTAEAIDLLTRAAEGVDGVLSDPPPQAYVDEFAGDEVVLRVQYWAENQNPGDALRVRSAVARQIKSDFEAAGITISPASEHALSGELSVTDRDRE